MARSNKFVYFFGGKKAEGNLKLKNLLGGKGAGLADMVNLGIPYRRASPSPPTSARSSTRPA
jgi:hypothetical protein